MKRSVTMSLRLSIFVLSLGACFLSCGCSDEGGGASDRAVRNACRAIRALSTNASMRVISASYSVRTNIALVSDREIRLSLIRDWESHLRGVPVEGLAPMERYAAIKGASDMLNSCVSAALWDCGCGYEEIWELHFRTLDWLDRQVRLMKPKDQKDSGVSRKEQLAAWTFYQALAEWREVIVENNELDFDERVGMSGMEKIEEVKHRFEAMIGRKVRPYSEIKRLGHYRKLVRARIEQERDSALGLGKEMFLNRLQKGEK